MARSDAVGKDGAGKAPGPTPDSHRWPPRRGRPEPQARGPPRGRRAGHLTGWAETAVARPETVQGRVVRPPPGPLNQGGVLEGTRPRLERRAGAQPG